MAMFFGGFGEGFPYTNFHDLNTDWIIKVVKDFLDQYTHIQQTIEDGETQLNNTTASGISSLENKTTQLEALLQAWYTTHSTDIANQLASAISDFNTSADNKAIATIASIPADYTTVATDSIAYYSAVADISSASNKLLKNINVNLILNATDQYWDDKPTSNNAVFINQRYSSGYNVQTYIDSSTLDTYVRIVGRNGVVFNDWYGITKSQIETLEANSIKYISAVASISSECEKKLYNINQNVVFNATSTYWDDTPTGRGGTFINFQYTSGYNEQFYIESARGHRFERIVRRSDGAIYRDWTLDTRTRFINKKVYCAGDSLMWGRTSADERATLPIPQNLEMRLPVTATNAGVNGDTIAHRSGGGSMYDRITNVDLSSYDYVIIQGGTNDYGQGLTLGNKNSTDTSTFWGAMKAILNYIYTQNPKMKIMLITPTFRNYVAEGGSWHYGSGYEMNGDGGFNLADMTDAMLELGEMYNIPVFNSRTNGPCNFRNYTTTMELTAESADRYLHLSDDSYKEYGNAISSFFESVF